jgi:hypothetical protein
MVVERDGDMTAGDITGSLKSKILYNCVQIFGESPILLTFFSSYLFDIKGVKFARELA